MSNDFFKFPSTPHLALLGNLDVRGDKVMTPVEREEFLRHVLVVEEKVDGANLGISFDADGNLLAQNRGAYLRLPGSRQWKKLVDWLAPRTDALFEQLADRYILFGEWCYAKHSVFYDRLPDWFLGFDVYDKSAGRFLSSRRRDEIMEALPVAQVPAVASGYFTLSALSSLLAKSRLSDQPMEGLYMRLDEGDWLVQRAKLVVPAFVQTIEQHWSRAGIKANRLKTEYAIQTR